MYYLGTLPAYRNQRLYFRCDECPICVGFEHRLRVARECGDDPQLEYCACDKMQTEFLIGGVCEDAFSLFPAKAMRGKRKTGMAYRREKSAQKKHRAIRMANTYGFGAAYTDDTNRYLKYPKNSNNKAFWKRYSNKKVRHMKSELFQRGAYAKQFDYWWTIT